MTYTDRIMDERRTCLLCGDSARRFKPDEDVNAFVWECDGCGTWRAGLARELALERMSEQERQALAARARKARQEGRILNL